MQRTDITNPIINSYKLKLVVDMSNGNPQTLFDILSALIRIIFVLGAVWKISIKWELLCLDDRNALFYMIKKSKNSLHIQYSIASISLEGIVCDII